MVAETVAGPGQHEGPLAAAERGGGAAKGRLEPADRLPGDAAGLLPLNAEQLVALHPAEQRRFHVFGIDRDHPLGGDLGRAGHPVEEPGGVERANAGPLLQHRLLEITAPGSPPPGPAPVSSSEVSVSPISRSAVWSSAAR